VAVTEQFVEMVLTTAKAQVAADRHFPHTTAGVVAAALGKTLGTTPPATVVVEAAQLLHNRGEVRLVRQSPPEASQIHA
jgi:hypothetical protein